MAVIELVLTPGAVITGKIIDNNNRAVAGAKVLCIVDNLTFLLSPAPTVRIQSWC